MQQTGIVRSNLFGELSQQRDLVIADDVGAPKQAHSFSIGSMVQKVENPSTIPYRQ
jgi:hypothetical protein